MTGEQNLRHELLSATNYDIDRAKACYDFVFGPRQTNADDGIYLITNDDVPVLFTGQILTDTEKSLYKGVGVKLGSKSLVVAKYDMPESKIALTKGQGGTRFITRCYDAIADWNGKENTDDIRDILGDDILLASGEYIPSLGELYFILLHIRDVNAALEAVGGKPLSDWYWSSTQYSATDAWGGCAFI